MQALAEKSFYYLSEDEIRRMKEAVTKLAQRLQERASSIRRRARASAASSTQATRCARTSSTAACRSASVFDRKRKDKPQVMVLCDVSDSVRNVSRFMLQFVYSLQDLYSKVRSFIFVSRHRRDHAALRGARHQPGASSRRCTATSSTSTRTPTSAAPSGRSTATTSAAVNKRTTVIVLGDARNNYNLPHEWVLKDIQQRAKQVIWLNPENRMTWGFGDSEMDRYRRTATWSRSAAT